MGKKQNTKRSTNGRPKGNFGPTGLGSKSYSCGGKLSTKKKSK